MSMQIGIEEGEIGELSDGFPRDGAARHPVPITRVKRHRYVLQDHTKTFKKPADFLENRGAFH